MYSRKSGGKSSPGVTRKAAAILHARGILERGVEKDRPHEAGPARDLKRQNFYVINQKIFEGWDEPEQPCARSKAKKRGAGDASKIDWTAGAKRTSQ